MAYTYPVKHIHNSMRGAPPLSGTVGAGIAMLDAFLLTGFGTVTALSVSVSGGVATATLQAGDTFEKGCVVLVSGATPSELNGEARVLTASNTSITWATTAANGAASGTITIKVAPVGSWEKLYSGTNKAVYRSTDPQASGFCLRVDDTGTTVMRVRGYEVMTDVDTGSGPFPTDAQISGGGYWVKSTLATATAVRYDLVADSRAFFTALAVASPDSAVLTAAPLRGFGDMLPLRPAGDVYSCSLSCAGSNAVYGTYSHGAFDRFNSGADAIYTPRAISGIGSAQQVGALPYIGQNVVSGGENNALGAFPSSVDGTLKYCRSYLKDGTTSVPRADIPGLLYIPQSGVASSIASRDTLQGSGDLSGRTLLAIGATSNTAASAPNGIYLLDTTGPWR